MMARRAGGRETVLWRTKQKMEEEKSAMISKV